MKQEIFILILAGFFIFVNLYFIASIEGSSFIQNNLEDGTVEITNFQKSFSITGSNIGLGENNQINILDSEGELIIKNSEGVVMTELSGLKTSEDVGNPSGYIRLDESGNVINFDGVANKNTAVKINKNQYSMTKDTRLTLKNDTATIKPAKAGDAFSFVRPSKNEKGEDDIALTSIELGENSLEIKEYEKEAIFSSESSFKINSLKIDKIGRGNPSISIDSQGKFSSYENAKINFNNGLSSSSIKRGAELYSPQKSLEFSKKELALDTPSSSYISYSDLSAEEEIAGIRIVYLNEKGSLDAAARSKTSVAGSSLMNAKFFVVCEGLGIDPNLSFDEMAKLLKEKSSDPNSNFYVTFGTRDKTGEPTGKKYGFGSQEVLNQMK